MCVYSLLYAHARFYSTCFRPNVSAVVINLFVMMYRKVSLMHVTALVFFPLLLHYITFIASKSEKMCSTQANFIMLSGGSDKKEEKKTGAATEVSIKGKHKS